MQLGPQAKLLDRVRSVLQRMRRERPRYTVITVAGTNGKGSAVALLGSILQAAGYRVGTYSSPHLLKYNERIVINGTEATDDQLVKAFHKIDELRGDTSLTYFEFGTLAAIEIFADADLDVAVMEVGLGGRLDAVNVLDSDVALVTTVDIDHVEWLGINRGDIAREKAGIFRAGRPAIYGDADPPGTLIEYAGTLGTPLYCPGKDYDCVMQAIQVLTDPHGFGMGPRHITVSTSGLAPMRDRR